MSPVPRASKTERESMEVEQASNELYGIAVAMHETIRDGKGAVGWNDPRVTEILGAVAAGRDAKWTQEIMALVIENKGLAGALRQIESMSWDSGSTPAAEVVSRIYCIARNALLPPKTPSGQVVQAIPKTEE